MLSPRDLKKGSFSKSLKGYAVGEVDEYIAYLLSKYTELYNAYAMLEGKYNLALEKLENAKNEENTISATIVSAQKMADAIVGEAKQKAFEITNSVSDTCDSIIDLYMTKVKEEREKLVKCEAAVSEFKDVLFDAYKKHLDLIEKIMPDEEPTPYLSDEELESKAVEFANEKISSGLGDGDVSAEGSNPSDDESAADDTSNNS